MRQVAGWVAMVALCCAASVAASEAPPDARLQEAQTAFDEADRFWDAGRYAEATARGEHALALREAVLGGTHPDVATAMDKLGLHLRQRFQRNFFQVRRLNIKRRGGIQI